MTATRSVNFQPGFHRCDEGYGICGGRLWFTLTVDDWGIEFGVYTDWGQDDDVFHAQSPNCTHSMHQTGYPKTPDVLPMAGPVCWHAPVPMFYGEWSPEASTDECIHTGGKCWDDAGYLIGTEAFRILRHEGSDALYQYLENLLIERQLETLVAIEEHEAREANGAPA